MFYRLTVSTKPSVIGKVSTQSSRALYSVHADDPNLSRNLMFRKVPDPTKVITPKPYIEEGAKLTDLINGSSWGLGFQLVMSDRLKSILSKYNSEDLQYFPVTLIYESEQVKDYWMANPFSFRNDLIDFAHSTVEVVGYGMTKMREIELKTFEGYSIARESMVRPESLFIREFKLREGIDMDFFLLQDVTGGIGYFVSEKLKKEIKSLGCTGMDFLSAH